MVEHLTEPFDLVEGDETGRKAGEGLVNVGASLERTGMQQKRLNQAWVRSTTHR